MEIPTIFFLIMICGEPQSIIEYNPTSQETVTHLRNEWSTSPDTIKYLIKELRDDNSVLMVESTKQDCI